MESIRIDKWLWTARFFKTRTIAQNEVELGRVLINGSRAKPSRELRLGDRLEIHRGEETFVVYVEGISNQRRPAVEAQQLYREMDESKMRREAMHEMRRIASEPSATIEKGRPTKRDGRLLRRLRENF